LATEKADKEWQFVGALWSAAVKTRRRGLWSMTDPAHPAALGQPLTGRTDAVTTVAF
jgi:hypothetical protein